MVLYTVRIQPIMAVLVIANHSGPGVQDVKSEARYYLSSSPLRL